MNALLRMLGGIDDVTRVCDYLGQDVGMGAR